MLLFFLIKHFVFLSQTFYTLLLVTYRHNQNRLSVTTIAVTLLRLLQLSVEMSILQSLLHLYR